MLVNYLLVSEILYIIQVAIKINKAHNKVEKEKKFKITEKKVWKIS